MKRCGGACARSPVGFLGGGRMGGRRPPGSVGNFYYQDDPDNSRDSRLDASTPVVSRRPYRGFV